MSVDSKPPVERRRAGWSNFRQSYPVFLKICAVTFLLLVGFNIWLGMRRAAYTAEISRLRENMSQAEREKSDLVIQSEKDRLMVAVELVKRQARWAPELNLSIDVDSGLMMLARDGALLRRMSVSIQPGLVPGGDSAIPAVPRGERSIVEVHKGADARIVLNGGMELRVAPDSSDASLPSPNGSGIVRISAADMKAILPNISAGMLVYLY